MMTSERKGLNEPLELEKNPGLDRGRGRGHFCASDIFSLNGLEEYEVYHG